MTRSDGPGDHDVAARRPFMRAAASIGVYYVASRSSGLRAQQPSLATPSVAPMYARPQAGIGRRARLPG